MTQTIAELLEQIAGYHYLLSLRYNELATKSLESEKVAQLSRYLSFWELRRAEQLKERINDNQYTGPLATWLKEKPELINFDLSDNVSNELSAGLNEEDKLLYILSEQHNSIFDIYKQLGEVSQTESMANFFMELADTEISETRKAVRNIQDFADL